MLVSLVGQSAHSEQVWSNYETTVYTEKVHVETVIVAYNPGKKVNGKFFPISADPDALC